MYVHMCVFGGQRTIYGSLFSFSTRYVPGSNVGVRTWQQVPLPSEPSPWQLVLKGTNELWVVFVVVPEPYSADPRRKEIGAGDVAQFGKSFCLALATRDCLKNIQAKGKSGLDISPALRRQRPATN